MTWKVRIPAWKQVHVTQERRNAESLSSSVRAWLKSQASLLPPGLAEGDKWGVWVDYRT